MELFAIVPAARHLEDSVMAKAIPQLPFLKQGARGVVHFHLFKNSKDLHVAQLYKSLKNVAELAFPRWCTKRIWCAYYPSGATKSFHQDKGASTLRVFIPITKTGAPRALSVRGKGTTTSLKISYSPGEIFLATSQLLGAAQLANGQWFEHSPTAMDSPNLAFFLDISVPEHEQMEAIRCAKQALCQDGDNVTAKPGQVLPLATKALAEIPSVDVMPADDKIDNYARSLSHFWLLVENGTIKDADSYDTDAKKISRACSVAGEFLYQI